MLQIRRSKTNEVVFAVIGQIEAEHIAELQRLFGLEHDRIALDLREVTLVDREVVKFLSQCESDSIGIRNCPSYIRKWIDREQQS